MKLTRLKVCQEVDQRLSQLKGRTGLTPNLLCRIGFCLSLTDPGVPNPDTYPPDSEREINRYTLTGEWDDYFLALLKERCIYDNLGIDNQMLEDQFRAHINRGVLMLYLRIKDLSDLNNLMHEYNTLPVE